MKRQDIYSLTQPFLLACRFESSEADFIGKSPMKLTQIALVAVISAAFVGPAFAAMTQAEMDTMKAEMDKAGKTPEEHMTFWKSMPPDRQAAWKAECNSEEALSLPEKEILVRGDIPSFCKSVKGAM